MTIARLLNGGVLPPGYYAVPFLDRDGPIEIDIATVGDHQSAERADGQTELQRWSAPSPALTLEVEWPDSEDVRVEVMSDDGDPPLAAAVELVSPRNKDRPRAREAFAAKCADYLRRGCGLVVVDAVTVRRADLHADLLAVLGAKASGATTSALAATSYRSVGRQTDGRLLVWPSPLEVGRALPTLPLWLRDDVVVPLDLEASHSAACADLRIRDAG